MSFCPFCVSRLIKNTSVSPPAKSHDAIVLADKLQPKAIVLADPIKQAIKTPVSSQIFLKFLGT